MAENTQSDVSADFGTTTGGIFGINTQEIMLLVGGVATILAIAALELIREKQSGKNPNKDYSNITNYANVSVLLSLVTAAYFTYFVYEQRKITKASALDWLLFANMLAVAGALIQAYVAFRAQKPSTDVISTE